MAIEGVGGLLTRIAFGVRVHWMHPFGGLRLSHGHKISDALDNYGAEGCEKQISLMSQGRKLYLVLYDIVDAPRQSRVRGFISAYAISHQKSFYECWLTASELAELIGHVGNALTDADRFHCFELDPRMLNRLTGTARRISTEPFLVV